MDPDTRALLTHLSVIGRELSADSVSALAREIEQLEGPSALTPSLGKTPSSRALRDRLRDLWLEAEHVSPGHLALALLAAQSAAEATDRSQIIDLIWTGPTTPGVPLRRTDQALYELIESSATQLLIVSFAAYKVERVKEALSRALDRGVSVRFVLESDEDGGSVRFDPSLALGGLVQEVELYGWPREKRRRDDRGRHGSLHAKCAAADGELALISSANLTEYALALNMEMGVLIRGGRIPKAIQEHFERLIDTGVLERQ